MSIKKVSGFKGSAFRVQGYSFLDFGFWPADSGRTRPRLRYRIE
jgi:hypothetical protein